MKVRRRVYLNFPEQLITDPVIWTMGKRFDVVTNVRRANVEAHSGWVVLEIDGEDDEIDRAIRYASDLGVEVNEMTGDILEG